MRWLVVLILALLLFSGCAAPTATLPARSPSPVTRGAIEISANRTVAVTNATLAAKALQPAFHWALTGKSAALVLELRLDLGSDNDCKVTFAESEKDDHPGPTDLVLAGHDGNYGWGEGSSGTSSLHAGPVDTRQVLSGSGYSGSLSSLSRLSGTYNVTLLAHDLSPWPADIVKYSFLPANVSAAFDIVCGAPFKLSAAQGHEVVLADAYSLAGGVGAATSYVAIDAQDTADASFTAPTVRMAASGFGAQVVKITAAHPKGSEDWTFLPSDLVTGIPTNLVTDGPGTYTFTVDQAGAYFNAFWCAAWGIDGPADLTAHEVPATVIRDPFA